MGFFPSRRHDSDVLSTSPNAQLQSTSPSTGIIRSRFVRSYAAHPFPSRVLISRRSSALAVGQYGRNKDKGKAREAGSTPNRGVASPSAAAESRNEPNVNDTATTHTTNGHHALNDVEMRGVSEPSLHSTVSPKTPKSPGLPNNARASTDAITIMLAQRLTELASANAEGLLDDDEYRLLRQNLFERLGNSTIPRENSLVPTPGPSRPRPPQTPQRSDSVRTPSLQSKGTVSSTVSGLFRRTSRRKASTDTDTLHSDTTSLLSAGSNSPGTFTRRLFQISLMKQSSVVSLRLDNSAATHENGSASYLASPGRPDGPSKPITPSVSRSSTTRSKRKAPAPTPPSAFHHRMNGVEQRRIQSRLLDEDLDDDVLKSSKEIHAQIEAVEAEGRRLMDAFNGLELSALTRKSQPNPISTLQSAAHFLQRLDSFENGWSPQSSKDPDGISMHSTTSNGTNLSTHRSPVRSHRTAPNTPLVSQPVSLARKTSLSSISSRGRGASASGAPYIPTLPSSLGRLWSGSSSSVNLARSTSHLPLATVTEGQSIEGNKRPLRLDTSLSVPSGSTPTSPRNWKNGVIGDDEDLAALETEMAEIRRRRTEVMGRYEERLGYLRAKLKGAELHEKLLRL